MAIKRTKLEIYAFTEHGTMTAFADYLGVTNMTLYNWYTKKKRPSKNNALMVERMTHGALTAEYMREWMD